MLLIRMTPLLFGVPTRECGLALYARALLGQSRLRWPERFAGPGPRELPVTTTKSPYVAWRCLPRHLCRRCGHTPAGAIHGLTWMGGSFQLGVDSATGGKAVPRR